MLQNKLDEHKIDISLFDISKIIKIQKWFRKYILPSIMYKMQHFLQLRHVTFSTKNEDGRINSCIDETQIIDLLCKTFGSLIKKAPKPRYWYDILAYDPIYNWIPINIKTTTTETSDNIGNLSICVQAYTNEILDFSKSYNNGEMIIILYNKLKNKQYNKCNKKDYYFIVLNKKDQCNVIVNSVKGLTTLTQNINNLPFQIRWKSNRKFKYAEINEKVKQLLTCLQQPPSWRETFILNIRTLIL